MSEYYNWQHMTKTPGGGSVRPPVASSAASSKPKKETAPFTGWKWSDPDGSVTRYKQYLRETMPGVLERDVTMYCIQCFEYMSAKDKVPLPIDYYRKALYIGVKHMPAEDYARQIEVYGASHFGQLSSVLQQLKAAADTHAIKAAAASVAITASPASSRTGAASTHYTSSTSTALNQLSTTTATSAGTQQRPKNVMPVSMEKVGSKIIFNYPLFYQKLIQNFRETPQEAAEYNINLRQSIVNIPSHMNIVHIDFARAILPSLDELRSYSAIKKKIEGFIFPFPRGVSFRNPMDPNPTIDNIKHEAELLVLLNKIHNEHSAQYMKLMNEEAMVSARIRAEEAAVQAARVRAEEAAAFATRVRAEEASRLAHLRAEEANRLAHLRAEAANQNHRSRNDTYQAYGTNNNSSAQGLSSTPTALHSGGNKKRRMNQTDDNEEHLKRSQRADRFGNFLKQKQPPSLVSPTSTGSNLVGTCQVLEKKYLRLTDEPNPSEVRPLNVLERAFDHVIKRYLEEKKEYLYLDEQLRSIRQDLKVQNIHNDFAIHVYQENAMFALKNNDLGQFNVCLTQLRYLYALPLGVVTQKGLSRVPEFEVYRILYLVLQRLTVDCSRLMLLHDRERPAYVDTDEMRWVLSLFEALNEKNFAQVFRLILKSPYQSRLLVDLFLEEFVLRALVAFCEITPEMSLRHFGKVVNFQNDLHALKKMLEKHHVHFSHKHDQTFINCKSTKNQLAHSALLKRNKVHAMG